MPAIGQFLGLTPSSLATTVQGFTAQAQAAALVAQNASDAALLSRGVFVSTAAALSKGVASTASLVGGSTGTNGTFALAFSGGGGGTGAAGVFVVSGGSVVSITITASGYGYTSAPTLSFAASAGLVGASATAVLANNVDPGEYFSVPSTSNFGYLTLYQNSAGTAVAVKEYPSVQGLEAATEGLAHPYILTPGTSTPLVMDSVGQVLISVDTTGTVTFNWNAIFQGITVGSSEFITDEFTQLAFAVADSVGNIAFAILTTGAVIIGAGGTGEIAPTDRKPSVFERFPVDVNQFLMNGQSLAYASGVLLPTEDPTDLTFFDGGLPKVYFTTANVGSTFGPMQTDGTCAILWNAMQQAKFLMAGSATYSADPNYNNDYTLLPADSAVPGATIQALSKGGSTNSYNDMIASVSTASSLALAGGLCHAVQSFSWIQGESNSFDSVATYYAAFQSMITDYRADIGAITNQPNDFKVLVYQPSSAGYFHTVGTDVPSNVAIALGNAAEADPTKVFVATPFYWVPTATANDLHPSALGYLQAGLMWGKVLYKVVYRGEDWQPVQPVRITAYNSTTIVVKFNVPEPPLVFDTTNVTNPGDYGFKVEDASGFVTIASVTLVNEDTVCIVTATPLGANPYLSYAYWAIGGNGAGPIIGARGNLRDSDPTVGVNGFDKLWNWCIVFNKPIPYVR